MTHSLRDGGGLKGGFSITKFGRKRFFGIDVGQDGEGMWSFFLAGLGDGKCVVLSFWGGHLGKMEGMESISSL